MAQELKSEYVPIRLPPSLCEQVNAIAQREDVTPSVIYRRAIKWYVASFFVSDRSIDVTGDHTRNAESTQPA